MQTGYEDIDNLNSQTSQLYDEQMKQQQNIINTSTQQTIDEIERNKKKVEQEALKTNKALYTDYQKQINPYGVNAENLAEQGLAGSGVAESTRANYYNTYQNTRTEATNNANTIKADFDAQITQARQNGDLQLAKSALELYQQKIQDLYNTYNLKFEQDQFNYNKEQNALTQSNWEKEYQQALQQAQWEQQFNQAQFDYQKERDAVADSQWQQEYELSKKKASSSGSSSGSGNSGNYSFTDDSTASQRAVDWYNSMKTIEQSRGRVTPEEELTIGLTEAIKQGQLDENDMEQILKMAGY